jgi:DNA-binding NtrC family response regulator
MMQSQIYDLVLANPCIKDSEGNDVMSLCRIVDPTLPVLHLVAFLGQKPGTPGAAANLRNAIAKPVRRDDLLAAIERVLESSRLQRESRELRGRLGIGPSFHAIIGKDPRLLEQIDRARAVARSNLPVIICGESGTGKELMAEAIHGASPRCERSMVTAFLSAEPLDLQLSALFGHVAGAFTGAVTSRRGWFREAHHSTLFLDEVGDIMSVTQAALLRVIEQKLVKAIGENTEHRIDTRIISATNRDLPTDIREGRFRRDLYQRLGGDDCIVMPPLRERLGDLPLLLDHFARQCVGPNHPTPEFDEQTIEAMANYDWPGNIRELKYKIEVAILRAAGQPLKLAHIQLPVNGHNGDESLAMSRAMFELPWNEAQAVFKEEYLRQLMERCQGDKTEAARLAQIDVSTIRRFLK